MIPPFVLDNTHIVYMNLGNASREQVAAEIDLRIYDVNDAYSSVS
jgi:hypothetical protein